MGARGRGGGWRGAGAVGGGGGSGEMGKTAAGHDERRAEEDESVSVSALCSGR